MDAKFSPPFEPTQHYLTTLRNLCVDEEVLRNCQYERRASPSDRIEKKLRCTKCLVRIEDRPPAAGPAIPPPQPDPEAGDATAENSWTTEVETHKHLACFYHVGRIVKSRVSGKSEWTCGEKEITSLGCVAKYEHTIPGPNDAVLADYWRFYPTPEPAIPQPNKTKKPRKQKKWRPFAELEKRSQDHRKAVALDCEMGTSSTLWPEMIRITVIDYFTGEVLMNKLVKPWMPMRSMNTKYGSGVTWADMNDAIRAGDYYDGAAGVREELFKFVSPETIVVVHAGQNDLNVMRWIHPLVADTQIRKMKTRSSGLASLASYYCNISLQTGSKGHCSLEDALATREIMHVMIQDKMKRSPFRDPNEPDQNAQMIAAFEADNGGVVVAGEEVDENYDGRAIHW